MSSLKKKVLNKEREHDSFARKLDLFTDPKSEDGWLAKLGEYRDLIRHYLPLGEINSASFLIQQLTNIGKG
jgi:hypothetical protein